VNDADGGNRHRPDVQQQMQHIQQSGGAVGGQPGQQIPMQNQGGNQGWNGQPPPQAQYK